MNRREFLIHGGSGLGAWLLRNELARRILQSQSETGAPLLVENISGDADHVLYANVGGPGYILTLGAPLDSPCEPDPQTWREYLEDRVGIDPDDPEQLADWFFDEGKAYFSFNDPALIDLSDTVADVIYENYLEWEWALNECPNASAYHFLAGLDLGPHRSRGGLNIGELLFTQGDHPGSHYTAVEVTSAAGLSCLHHRLAELGHGLKLEVVE